ncbi:hypothetical protein L581_4209 [Serratia fonticola AU-AP2C]|nr:hypothetical protein L581_4209 [Serratia fonticola AU-AP2C]
MAILQVFRKVEERVYSFFKTSIAVTVVDKTDCWSDSDRFILKTTGNPGFNVMYVSKNARFKG